MADRFWVEEDDDSSVSPVWTRRNESFEEYDNERSVASHTGNKTPSARDAERVESAARFVIEEDDTEKPDESSALGTRRKKGNGIEDRFTISDVEPEDVEKKNHSKLRVNSHTTLSRTINDRSSSSLSAMKDDVTMPQLFKEVKRISLQNHKLHSMLDKLLVASGEASSKSSDDKKCPVTEAQKNMKGLLADLGKGGHELINECIALKKKNAKLEAQLSEARAKIRSLTTMVGSLKQDQK